MINVCIPASGEGSRFKIAGFDRPKPLIDLYGRPMIERVIDNLKTNNATYTVLARSEHLEQYNLWPAQVAHYVKVEGLTQGAACTVMLAANYIDNDHELVIANSDQLVNINFQDFIDDARSRNLDGSIMCFNHPARNPKWSYAEIDSNGRLIQVKEKDPISEWATVGIYYFKHGSVLVQAINDMIAANDRTNNEFYLCPAYNYMLSYNVGIYTIDETQMVPLGVPEDYHKSIEQIKNGVYKHLCF